MGDTLIKKAIQASSLFSLLWSASLLSTLCPLPAQAAELPPVKIATEPPAYYETIQDAFSAAPAGALIQTRNKIFPEILTLDRNITLQGGFNTDYSAVVGVTYLEGDIIITAGTITIGDFQLTAEPPVKIVSPGPTANVSTPLLNFDLSQISNSTSGLHAVRYPPRHIYHRSMHPRRPDAGLRGVSIWRHTNVHKWRMGCMPV